MSRRGVPRDFINRLLQRRGRGRAQRPLAGHRGHPGFAPDGTLPSDFAGQASNAWDNVKRLLDDAGFALSDLVKVTTSVTNVSDIAAHKDIRRNALEDLKPAFMLAVVTQMIDPRILIEIEAWAAKPIDGGN